jgi:hypothetical protein
VIAVYVAAAVVALVQYFRLRERWLLPMAFVLALESAAHFRGEWDPWGRLFHVGAALAALALVLAVAPRLPAHR